MKSICLGVIEEAILSEVLDELAGRIVSRLQAASVPPPTGGSWRLLTVAHASELLGRSPRWVRERVHDGSLPHVRLDGGALAFDLADVRGFAVARRIDIRDRPEERVVRRRELNVMEPGWEA